MGSVPLLVLAFALTGQLGLTEATVEGVRGLLYDTVLSDAVGQEITAVVESLLGRVDLSTVGSIGVLGLMAITSQIYFQVELAFNDIFPLDFIAVGFGDSSYLICRFWSLPSSSLQASFSVRKCLNLRQRSALSCHG